MLPLYGRSENGGPGFYRWGLFGRFAVNLVEFGVATGSATVFGPHGYRQRYGCAFERISFVAIRLIDRNSPWEDILYAVIMSIVFVVQDNGIPQVKLS